MLSMDLLIGLALFLFPFFNSPKEEVESVAIVVSPTPTKTPTPTVEPTATPTPTFYYKKVNKADLTHVEPTAVPTTVPTQQPSEEKKESSNQSCVSVNGGPVECSERKSDPKDITIQSNDSNPKEGDIIIHSN